MSVSRFVAGLLLVTAALALGASLAATATQEHSSAQGLIERLASPSADERKEAREWLLSLGAAAVPPLILATKSDSALLRWEAVNLLGMIADPRGIDAVLSVAMTDSDVHARWRANWAVTRLGDGAVVPCLIAALEEEDRTIAWNAAVTLSMFGRVEAVPLLHQGLQAVGWRQWEAVNCLGRVWNDKTAPKLIVVLQEGPEDVRKEAVLSLGRIGGENALIALLEVLSDDPSFEVRWRAAMMISHIGDQETVALLMEIQAREAHPFVIEQIDEAIDALILRG
jgi:HEAT repeat protein